MRRMIPSPAKLINCSFENVGRQSCIYVPFKSVNDLPVKFDLIVAYYSVSIITTIFAWYSFGNVEVYGGGSFVIPGDQNGNIRVYICVDSLIDPEYPYLKLELSYDRGDIQTAPLNNNAQVFVSNVVQLEKGVIEIPE